MMDELAVRAVFDETQALRSGHFELRSGLHSDQYFQCALALQYPFHTTRLCEALLARGRAGLGSLSSTAVIAPALGGITVGFELGRLLGVRSIFAEKKDGRLELRRGFGIGSGERCIVAEDVITRGGRVQEVIDIVEAQGGLVEAVLVMVDRSGGSVDFGVPLFSLLEVVPTTWEPSSCPLCEQGLPLEHPGS